MLLTDCRFRSTIPIDPIRRRGNASSGAGQRDMRIRPVLMVTGPRMRGRLRQIQKQSVRLFCIVTSARPCNCSRWVRIRFGLAHGLMPLRRDILERLGHH